MKKANRPDIDSVPLSTASLQYLPGEVLYANFARASLANGWTIIPQERGERRISSRIDGRALQWGKYIDQMPTPEEVHHWSNQAPGANGAILLGKASGLTFCFDLDIMDVKLVNAVMQLADKIFGETRFARQGQAPKMALFYRVATEDELPPNRSWRFVDETGTGVSEHLIELQSRGKLITAFGYHHKTDRYFQWEGPQPSTAPVTDVLLVTPAKIDAFIDAVQDIRAFHRNSPARASDVEFEAAPDGTIQRPKIKVGDNTDAWVVDPATGLIVDGREAFLWDIAQLTVRKNPELAEAADGQIFIRNDVIQQFKEAAALTGKWSEAQVRQQAMDKVGRAVRDLREGRTKPLGAAARLKSVPVPKTEHQFLMLSKRKIELPASYKPVEDAERQRRVLNTDRDAASSKIATQISTALGAAFDAVYDGRTEEVHSIPGATGSGKTSQAIRMIEADPRTYWDDELPLQSEKRIGPWVFMLPTYNNVSELKERADVLGLDPTLDDAELMAQATMMGIHPHDRTLDELRDNAVASKLRTMVYQGKSKAGCRMTEVLEPLMAANIRTGQLCKAKEKDQLGKDKEVFCQFYSSCEAIAQRHRIETSHIVFVVQNFLTLAVPEELTKVRGVILDERVFHLVLNTTSMGIKTLEKGRRPPRLTKAEIEQNLVPEDLVASRVEAAEIAVEELLAGRDVAKAFLAHPHGARLVHEAKRVVGGSMNADQHVFPNMTPADVTTILAKPTGFEIAEEWRFWSIIEDRLQMLAIDEQMAKIQPKDEALAAGDLDAVVNATRNDIATRIPQQAMGETDARIQYLSSKERVRLSWRSDMNWSDKTRILLDASMDERITERIFPEANVVAHPIDSDLNLRVLYACDMNWSISSIAPLKSDGPVDLAQKASRLAELRRFISKLAGIYAHGCVIIGMPKRLRDIVQRDWVVPFNIDIRHLGAVKGLDFGKEHVAAVQIGRLEPPTDAIDGQVGALTYRDPVPEPPIDLHGTGETEDGKQIFQSRVPRRIRLRDQDAFIEVQEHAGPLARAVQNQYREEEARQLIGRVRPIHRHYTADAIVVGQSLPEDVVVDALTTFSGMMMHSDFWDLVRRCGGIIDLEAMKERAPMPVTSEELQQQFEDLFEREQVLARYHRITSKTADGRVVQWYIPGYFSDREEVVRAYAQECAPRDEILTIRMSGETVMPHARAPEDDISRECGDVGAQFEAEAKALRPVVEMAIRRGKYKPGQILLQAGTGEWERTRITFDSWPILNRWIAERAPPAEETPVEETAPVVEDVVAPPQEDVWDGLDWRAFG